MSVADDLRHEADGTVHHEYVMGRIHAMAESTEAHNIISGNIVAALHTHLRGGPCQAYMADFKVRLEINREDIFYYPDVMVACQRVGVEHDYLRLPNPPRRSPLALDRKYRSPRKTPQLPADFHRRGIRPRRPGNPRSDDPPPRRSLGAPPPDRPRRRRRVPLHQALPTPRAHLPGRARLTRARWPLRPFARSFRFNAARPAQSSHRPRPGRHS